MRQETIRARGETVSPGPRGRVWFVVPAYRRVTLSTACFKALAATCSRLRELGVDGNAVVVSDDANLDVAADAGLHTVAAPNRPLGAKWNAGYEYACRQGDADYVIPFGSDDIVDAEVIAASLPGPREVTCFRKSAVVSPDGRKMALITVTYQGGDGVKIIPAPMLSRLGYRPLDDSRERALDGSMLETFARKIPRFRFVYRDQHPLQIVDFKSPVDQLTTFDRFNRSSRGVDIDEIVSAPFARLAASYPDEVLAPVRSLYVREKAAA